MSSAISKTCSIGKLLSFCISERFDLTTEYKAYFYSEKSSSTSSLCFSLASILNDLMHFLIVSVVADSFLSPFSTNTLSMHFNPWISSA